MAEALGLEVFTGDGDMLVMFPDDDYILEDFFTQSIANCKKYIEPVLLNAKKNDNCEGKRRLTRFSSIAKCSESLQIFINRWEVKGFDIFKNTLFYGEGETEEIALCNALLDLKEREKNEV